MRKLTLARETLAELATADLARVHGAIAPPTLAPGCQVFSDLLTCLHTAGMCPPPPR